MEISERYAEATQLRAAKAEQQAAIVLVKFESAARELADAQLASATIRKEKI